MEMDQFRQEDLEAFLALAIAEGWICGRWEFDFLFRTFPQGCLLAREGGIPVGFVTSIKYGESGWIGNLIVRGELRGKGIGTALMEKALAALADAGAATVWLTASRAGKPIYEALGFTTVDVVNRWVGEGIGGKAPKRESIPRAEILAIDQAGWGDRREAIIDAVAGRGRVLATNGAFLVRQPCADGIQLGPWGGTDSGALLLLNDVLAEVGYGQRVFLDVPIRNSGQTALLLGMGFSVRGSTLLMYRGEEPAYAPGRIFALASMGSMG
jgi:ribosomal protein S18 acetylase RimI-like enzyme